MRWRAVQFGVAVTVLLGFFLLVLPPYGHLAVGLAGGFVGGVLAGGGPRPGARHGAAVGAVGATLALVAGGALVAAGDLATAVPPPVEPFLPLSLGGTALTLLGAALFLAGATVAGALGGWLRGEAEFPDRLESERALR